PQTKVPVHNHIIPIHPLPKLQVQIADVLQRAYSPRCFSPYPIPGPPITRNPTTLMHSHITFRLTRFNHNTLPTETVTNLNDNTKQTTRASSQSINLNPRNFFFNTHSP